MSVSASIKWSLVLIVFGVVAAGWIGWQFWVDMTPSEREEPVSKEVIVRDKEIPSSNRFSPTSVQGESPQRSEKVELPPEDREGAGSLDSFQIRTLFAQRVGLPIPSEATELHGRYQSIVERREVSLSQQFIFRLPPEIAEAYFALLEEHLSQAAHWADWTEVSMSREKQLGSLNTGIGSRYLYLENAESEEIFRWIFDHAKGIVYLSWSRGEEQG